MRLWTAVGTLVTASALAWGSEPGRPRARDLGTAPGVFEPGLLNAITDVKGVRVGQLTLRAAHGPSVPGL